MRRLSIFPLLLFIVLNSAAQQNQWKLIWNDEFEQDGLPDPQKWTYDVGYIANNEKQYYTRERSENTRIEDGLLIIEAIREPWEGFEYTSGRLITRGLHEWTYGRFEIKAKVPLGVGTWPAIWMLGANIREVGWPKCGEIDIMEHVGFDPNIVHGNIHTRAYNHTRGTNKGNEIELEKPWDNFHVYAVEWFEDRIDFYVDDVKYFTFEKEPDANDDVWPFDKPHYLLLNLAIGGNWGGRQGIDDSVFPHRFYIDYVRVYELNDD